LHSVATIDRRVSTLQNHRCFLKAQARVAWVELAWVLIAQVAEKIDLLLAVRKEFRIQPEVLNV
jgi:hypothetical protein